MYEIKINKGSVFTLENKQAKLFKAVKVFAADPWYIPLHGKIRNLSVETKGDADDTDDAEEVDSIDDEGKIMQILITIWLVNILDTCTVHTHSDIRKGAKT